MNVISVGNRSLSGEEKKLLQIVNNYSFELPEKQLICFGDLLKEVRIVLDGSAFRSNIINPSSWKLNDPKYETEIKVELFQRYRGIIEKLEQEMNSLTSEKKEDVDCDSRKENVEKKCEIEISIKKFIKEYKKVTFYEGQYVDCYNLKGLFKPSDKSIVLYMDNMSQKDRLEDVVSVYIHEMFHAYYHSLFKCLGESVREIEECMVEFSMLTFLEYLSKDDKRFETVYEHAKNEVEGKRWKIGNLAAYGFGKYVFDTCLNKKEWIAEYAKKSRILNKEKALEAEFVGRVYPFYPIRERNCYELLKLILFPKDVSDATPKIKFKLMDDFHDVALRILLIDDKIDCKDSLPGEEKKLMNPEETEYVNEVSDKNIEVDETKNETKVDVNECRETCSNHKCKLCTIKRLMDSGKNDNKVNVYDGIGIDKDYFYWKEQKIECYYCPTITEDFIDNESVLNGRDGIFVHPTTVEDKKNCKQGKYIDYAGVFFPKINKDDLHVQIVGVRDVRTALLLMSRYKFDMIFCDYLLDYKNENKDERDYIKQLFDFLSHNYKKDIQKEKEQKPQDEAKIKRLEVLEQLRHDVLDNRGPLGKFWVMPITGFNQTFIQDLHRSQINLIDYRWNINNGADPITTPWQFLYHLNKFLELQLRSCVYTMEQLLTFLLYTCQDLNTIEDKEEKKVDFDDFQSFMGSEYATLIQLYGNKFPIKRDAVIEDNDGNGQYKSVFATYVWNNFYANKERKFVNEIELYRLMHRFYHRATVMYNDQRGKKLLNDAFASLQFFLYSNSRVRDTIVGNETLKIVGNDALKELYESGKGLNKLKEVVEKCTSDQNNGKDKE